MASFVAEKVGEAKVLVCINGEQIKGSPYSIVVRNYQAIDKPSNIVNNNGSMGQPWGVEFGRNGLWAVADYSNHCVYIFDDRDELVRKFGTNGNNNGQFSNLAFDNHNHLYVPKVLILRIPCFLIFCSTIKLNPYLAFKFLKFFIILVCLLFKPGACQPQAGAHLVS